MKSVLRFFILAFAIAIISAKLCNEDEIDETEKCNQTEYESYVECIRRRMKRSVSDCDYQSSSSGSSGYGVSGGGSGCSDCDCDYCQSNQCESTCSNCCSRNQCSTHHCCHKTCNLQCRSSPCKKDCRRSCVDKIQSEKTIIKEVSVSHESEGAQRHNITTIINLQNTINNTNIIDVPVFVNNTNYHNFTLGNENYAEYQGGGGSIITQQQQQDNCCRLVGPRRCVPISVFPFQRCFHVRSKHCGSVCRAPTIHVQKHEICDVYNDHRQPTCREQAIYIPQPRPRCVHQQKWPFVTCGMLEAECSGCYAHHSNKKPYVGGCPSACFDDGYGIGPMYRQGPYYRPGYSPVPSCYQLGNCGQDVGYGSSGTSGFGFYGGGYPPESYNTEIMNIPSNDFGPSESGKLLPSGSGPSSSGPVNFLPYGQSSGLNLADHYIKAKRDNKESDSIKAPPLVTIHTNIKNNSPTEPAESKI